jgi:integrase
MPKLKRFKKAASGQGSILSKEITRKDGSTYTRWQGYLSLGKDGNGKRKRSVVYGSSQAEVLAKMDTIKRQVATGTYSEDKRTLREYLEDWLKHKVLTTKPRTHEFYTDYAIGKISPIIGGLKLAKVNPAHVRSMMQELNSKVSADCANKCRVVLTIALRQAVKDGLIHRNPCDATEPLKRDNPSKDLEWSASEVVMFLNQARTHRHYAAFYLALSTGMRHGEILGLHWSDIEGDVLHVRRNLVRVKGSYFISSPKTERSLRRVVLDPETISVLEEHHNKQQTQKVEVGKGWSKEAYTDLVFTDEKGDPMNPRNFDRDWHKLQDKTRKAYIAEGLNEEEKETRAKQVEEGKVLAKIRFHDFRHMHVSLLNKAGVDARTIADRIGHTDPSFTLKRYAHVFEGDYCKSRMRGLTARKGMG